MTNGPSSGESRRRLHPAALAILISLLVIAALIVFDMQRITTAGAYARVGPTMVPYVVAGALVLLAVLLWFTASRHGFPEVEKQRLGPVAIICVGLLAQILLISFAGFIVATAALFTLAAYGFGERRIQLTLPFALIFSALIWIVFARLLRLTLPAGPIERFIIETIASVTGYR